MKSKKGTKKEKGKRRGILFYKIIKIIKDL